MKSPATLLFFFVIILPFSGVAQEIPQLSIPMSEIRAFLDVSQEGDFALVYKGDTLSSYTSTDYGATATLFDEQIEIVEYSDSLVYRYSLANENGVKSFSLPDTLPLYFQYYSESSQASYTIRYDSERQEKFKKEVNPYSTEITKATGTYTEVTTIQDTRWMVKYTSANSDSSYLKIFNNDSTLQQWSYVLNKTNGERITETQIYSHANYNYTKGFHMPDTNYNYSLNIDAKGDTIQHERFTQKFKDSDSTYFCRDVSGAGYVAHTEQFKSPEKDSTYTVDSRTGTRYTIHYLDDSLTVRKAFDLNGNLAYRSFMKETNGDYGVEEILEKRDTFYHVINYYHQLYWDKDHITDFFPYYKQVYLDEDSAVIRVLDYSFEKQDDWPVLTITEGDSSWVESTGEGGSSKYAIEVAFCGGAISRGVGIIIEDDPFSAEGAITSKTVKKLEEVIRGCAKYEIGISGPPFYFFYSEDQEKLISPFKRLSTSCSSEVDRILRRSKKQKVILHEKGTEREVECVFFKLDFKYSFGVIEKPTNR